MQIEIPEDVLMNAATACDYAKAELKGCPDLVAKYEAARDAIINAVVKAQIAEAKAARE